MNLIAFLKSNKNTRKLFGKAELKIVEKQLSGIDLTQSEKNRLSRDIRQKLEFIKEAARFSGEFELKKGAIIKEIVGEARKTILEDGFVKRIKKIVLYGSAVEKTLTFKSDIDIAIEFSEISLKEATLFRKRILGKVSPRVDIQVYNHLPEKIKKGVDAGRALYESKN